MSRRTERIAEQLRTEIARVLSVEATDPRIRLVTLTRVDVAPDLSRAVVLWSALETTGPESIEQVDAGLRSAASFVRKRLSQLLPLRRVPELHFRFDPSLVKGDNMLALLKDLSSERAEAESTADHDSNPSDPVASESEAVNQAGIEGTNGEST